MGQGASRARASQRLRYAKDGGTNSSKSPDVGLPKPTEAPVDGGLEVGASRVAVQPSRYDNAAVDTMSKDPVLSGFLDQLGGSVAKREVREYYGEGTPDPIKRRKKGELLEGDSMRLGITSLVCLLEESKGQKQQTPPDIKSLAASYEVDPEVLEKVLRYCTLPTYRENEEGKIVGSRS